MYVFIYICIHITHVPGPCHPIIAKVFPTLLCPQKSPTYPQKSLKISAKEIYTSAKEPYTSANEPYTSAKEPAIISTYLALATHHSKRLSRTSLPICKHCSLAQRFGVW